MIVDTRVTIAADDGSRRDPVAVAGRIDAAMATAGVTRHVLVQPGPLNPEEPLLLDALAALGPRGAGVAALDPFAVDAMRAVRLAASGIRGVLLLDREVEPGRFAAATAVARRMRGHVELAAPPFGPAAAALVAQADAPVVIEHRLAPEGEAGERLLALLGELHVWVKLLPQAVPPDPAWLQALLEAAPQRCVWGSDWSISDDAASYADLLSAFRQAVGDRPTADRVLGENAAKLYGF